MKPINRYIVLGLFETFVMIPVFAVQHNGLGAAASAAISVASLEYGITKLKRES